MTDGKVGRHNTRRPEWAPEEVHPVSDPGARTVGEDPALVAMVREGTEAEFAALVQRHRKELRVHCYRLLGNLDDAEDTVQEVFVKAWRGRAGFEGRSTVRAWLYRIATNACLDVIKRRRRRVRVVDATVLARRGASFDEVPWLQPIPDRLLDEPAPGFEEPDALVIAAETVALAFLAAIQHVAPRPRAVLIMRDVLGWSAAETAAALDDTVAAVNSALQRARARMRQLGRPGETGWAATVAPSDEERALLERYMDAHARADASAVIELLGENVSLTMPTVIAGQAQEETRFDGRHAVAGFFAGLFGPENPGDWRLVPTRANRHPAVANYVRRWGEATYRGITLDVLRIEGGVVVDITTFDASVFPAFGLPASM
jgi:RNA polymerase sigma-70 factor (ECF subfamily)